MRTDSQMLDFKIGDRVTFQPEAHPPLVGMLTRYNRKPVMVITDNGQHWNVWPSASAQGRASCFIATTSATRR